MSYGKEMDKSVKKVIIESGSKKSLPAIPEPKTDITSKKIEKIEKASEINPDAIASALKNWLNGDK